MCIRMPSTSDSNTMTASSTGSGAVSALSPAELQESSRLKMEPLPQPAPSTSTAGRSSSNNVDETDSGGSDEVKVFNDEDEREAAPSGAESQQVDILSDIKSRLITETEQGKSDLRRDYGAFMSMSLAGMSPYTHLMSPMSYAAAAVPFTNGLGPARPPLFYGDHLSSPPPAHMAGLRPPMPYLPHASQYPPYMLPTGDHLAAWHQQAAMYQSGAALRAASPYSLPPITSNGLPSPMSRFSPTGFLGHPGLSPAQAAAVASAHGAGHHLPHKRDRSMSRQSEKSPVKKNKEPHIKKPLNAFMLYMKEMRPVVQAECTLKESAAINQILGRRWHSLSRDEQAKYYEKARMERQKHLQMYPHWNARDNYRFNLKKKKRKRDKADDPAASMKKCRARYGLDQQEQWCRPCRRKKKCIRVQAYLDSKANADSKQGHPNHINNNDAMVKVENSSTNGHSIHSDGEDEDLDDIDDDNSPRESGNGRESLESNSEQSVTSPAGFGSLPSLGSPASLASPSTPQAYDNIAPPGPPSGGSSDWLRLPSQSGAFRPPVTAPTSSSSVAPSSDGPFHQYHPGHFYNAYNGLMMQHHLQNMHREPVGTDPRDSKNPLSISQLTGTKKAAAAAALGGSGMAVHQPAPTSSSSSTSIFGSLSGQNCSSSGSPAPVTPSEKRTILGMT